MKILTKPKPNEKFFALSPRQATRLAMHVAREYGGGQPDWQVFREFTKAYAEHHPLAEKAETKPDLQLSLV